MNNEYGPSYGYKGMTGTGITHEILASDECEIISILIDSATRDTGNTPDTTLRRGLLLAWDTVNKRYIELTTGATESAAAVVLAEDIFKMDEATDHVVAKAYYKANFKTGALIDDSASFDPALCPRLFIRDNV